MSIKNEIEKLRKVKIEREETLKAQLLGEIEQLAEKGIQGTLRQVEPYLDALNETGSRDYLEELRRTYDLKYKPARRKKIEPTGWFGQVRWEETPAVEAILETSVDVGEKRGGWSFSTNRLADKIQGRFDEIRQNLINKRLSVDSIRKMVQDPVKIEEFHQEMHEELGVRETRCAQVKLKWDYRHVYTGTYASGDRGGESYHIYGSNIIEAVVSRKDDKRHLHIGAGVNIPITELDLPEEEWKPNSIREAIIQGFLKLSRDSLG